MASIDFCLSMKCSELSTRPLINNESSISIEDFVTMVQSMRKFFYCAQKSGLPCTKVKVQHVTSKGPFRTHPSLATLEFVMGSA